MSRETTIDCQLAFSPATLKTNSCQGIAPANCEEVGGLERVDRSAGPGEVSTRIPLGNQANPPWNNTYYLVGSHEEWVFGEVRIVTRGIRPTEGIQYHVFRSRVQS